MSNSEINTEQLKKEVKEELLKREIMMGLQEDEIDLFELFSVLKRNWIIIIIFPIIVSIIVAGYSLSLPNFYKSSGTIFIHSSGSMSGLAMLMSNFSGISGLGGSGGDIGNYLTVFLKSATMSNYIIDKFGIATNPAIVGQNFVPNPTKPIIRDQLLQKMSKIVSIENDPKQGLITISAETMSATESARIVDAYIKRLTEFAKGPQKEKRKFIEKQLAEKDIELKKAEENFQKYQSENKIFAIDRQAEKYADKLASLETQKATSNISLEMQRSLLKSSGSVPELVKVESQKVAEEAKTEAIQKEINELESQLQSFPEKSLNFLRLQRDLKVKEKLYAVLSEQLEMAKIAEKEERSQFEVIDEARIPELKSKPRRSIMVILSGLSSGVLVVFLVFLKEFIRKRKETENQEKTNKSVNA